MKGWRILGEEADKIEECEPPKKKKRSTEKENLTSNAETRERENY